MNIKTYNILKGIALVYLPALGTLYFALAGIWGLPYAEEIIGTIVAVDTALGAVLHISGNKAIGSDGVLWVHTGADKDVYSLDVKTPLEQIPAQKEVRLAVRQPGANDLVMQHDDPQL